jgi:hypothetical protein
VATVLAALLASVVAVAGWIVNQALARRAIRRNLRIEYLLSAYRRLENASNRRMTVEHEAQLEAAVADIQLLGSVSQVALASTFAREFADTRQADTEPLLQDLRASLRSELLLDEVPPKRTYLRISRAAEVDAGPSATTSSLIVWREQEERVLANLPERPVVQRAATTSPDSPAIDDAALAAADPMAVVDAWHSRLEHELRRLLGTTSPNETSNLLSLVQEGYASGLVTEASRNAVEGLVVMHNLARLDATRGHLDAEQAQDYAALSEALIYALRQPVKR